MDKLCTVCTMYIVDLRSCQTACVVLRYSILFVWNAFCTLFTIVSPPALLSQISREQCSTPIVISSSWLVGRSVGQYKPELSTNIRQLYHVVSPYVSWETAYENTPFTPELIINENIVLLRKKNVVNCESWCSLIAKKRMANCERT